MGVTFNLRNGSYRPYKKPNNELKYINVLSNHPPQILKQLTRTISDRLSRNSSSELIFNESKHQYEDALSKSGFKDELRLSGFKTQQHLLSKKMISRKRKIIWFNLPHIIKMCQQISPKYSSNWLRNIFHATIDYTGYLIVTP